MQYHCRRLAYNGRHGEQDYVVEGCLSIDVSNAENRLRQKGDEDDYAVLRIQEFGFHNELPQKDYLCLLCFTNNLFP